MANPSAAIRPRQLGFLPLIEAGLIDDAQLIADAKSGVSGAGRKAGVHTLLCEAGENWPTASAATATRARDPPGPARAAAGHAVGLTFVPHLTPMIRHPRDAVRAAEIRCRCRRPAGAVRVLLRERDLRRRAAGPVRAPETLGARRQHLPDRRAPAAGRRHRRRAVGHRQSGQGAAGPPCRTEPMFGQPETAGIDGIALLP